MKVEAAEAQLALAKAEAAWVKAKQSGKKDAAYLKAEKALIEARNEYRDNWRREVTEEEIGSGDAVVTYDTPGEVN